MLNIITKWLFSQSNNGNLCLYWRCWLYRQFTADLMAGNWRILLFLFFSHTGDVVSALMWRQLRGTPRLPLAFIASSPLYKWCILYYSSRQKGRSCSMLTSTRHGLWLSFSLNKFFILIINLTVITKSVNLAQIRKLRVWLKSAPPSPKSVTGWILFFFY